MCCNAFAAFTPSTSLLCPRLSFFGYAFVPTVALLCNACLLQKTLSFCPFPPAPFTWLRRMLPPPLARDRHRLALLRVAL